MCGGGSSGGSGETRYNWNDNMAPRWDQVLNVAGDYADNPYQQYDGQRIAGINADQNLGMSAIRNFALNSGSPATRAANGQLQQTLQGDYLTGDLANPYSGEANPWQDASAQIGQNEFMDQFQNPYNEASNEFTGLQSMQNPYGGMQTSPGFNQYGGDNPHFRGVMQQGMQDITTAHQQGAQANTNRMAAMSGAFGGSAHQQMIQNDQAGLDKTLSQYAQGMQNTQYDRSAGLEEGMLGRNFQGQMFDRGIGNQDYENALNRAYQSQEGQIGRGFGSMESDIARRFGGAESAINRDLQNQQFDKGQGAQMYEALLNRGSGNYENERNRQLGAVGGGQNEQALALQRYNSLVGTGDVQRGYEQDLLNQQYNDWQEQSNYPRAQLDYLTGLYGRAQGGMSPNSTVTQSGYGASPFSSVLGAGLMGYGLMNGGR